MGTILRGEGPKKCEEEKLLRQQKCHYIQILASMAT